MKELPLTNSVCPNCGKLFEHKRFKRRVYCSPSCQYISYDTKVTIACQNCGKEKRLKPSLAKRTKYCSYFCSATVRRGEKSPQWRGGVSGERALWQGRVEYKDWRKAVYERDNYTCVGCGDDTGGNLNADHIKPWSLYPELRFDIDNGQTLCVPCHKKTPTYGKRVLTYAKGNL